MKSPQKERAVKEPPRKRVVNISEDVWILLGNERIGFETPDAVLRRLFGLPEKQRKDKDEETTS